MTQRYEVTLVAVVIVVMLVFAGGFVASRRGADNARRDFRRFTQPEGETQPATAGCTKGSPQLRGQAALESIDYPWERLGYRFSFEGSKKGLLALTDTGTKVIHLYVRPCQGTADLAHTLAHEIGHAVDDRHFDDAERAQIGAYRGYSPRPWFPTGSGSDYATPAGDWAEVFAQLVGPPGAFRSTLAGPPSEGPQTEAMRSYIR